MAQVDLILNSTGKIAVAKLQVVGFRVRADNGFSLSVFLTTGLEIQFEIAADMATLQPLINTFVTATEA